MPLLLSALLTLNLTAFSQTISTGVGIVRGRVLTSREVQIQNLFEGALQAKAPPKLLSLDSKAFAQAVQDALLESVVSLEAENFNVVQVTPEELKAAERKVNAIKKSAAWRELQVSPGELEAGLRRKVQAQKFVKFRAQSSVLPITDAEAEKYFNENRLKFGNLPFENLKENIKSYLGRAQMEKRLKDWYDVLLNKYQAKNLLAEI